MITKNELKKLSKKELLRALELATNTPDLFIRETKDLKPPVLKDEETTINFTLVPGSTSSEGSISSSADSNVSPSSNNILSGSYNTETTVQE